MKAFRQAFVETKYLGPTNHRNARIKAINVTTGKYTYVSFHAGASNVDAHEWAARLLFGMIDSELGDGTTDRKVIAKYVSTGSGPLAYEGDLLSCGTKTGYIFTKKT